MAVSAQICSLMRGGIAERGGVRVGHRIIEINGQSVVATAHEKIVQALSNSVGEVRPQAPRGPPICPACSACAGRGSPRPGGAAGPLAAGGVGEASAPLSLADPYEDHARCHVPAPHGPGDPAVHLGRTPRSRREGLSSVGQTSVAHPAVFVAADEVCVPVLCSLSSEPSELLGQQGWVLGGPALRTSV